METLTIDKLLEIFANAAGADESIDMTGDVADTEFEQLGYESLAILEAAGAIERTYGVKIDEDDLFEAHTPTALLELVNRSLRDKAA